LIQLTAPIRLSESFQRGLQIAMSEWTDAEGDRLKNSLAARRVKDEKTVQDDQLKQAKGTGLWEATRAACKQAVDKINERAGTKLLLWRSEKSNEVDVIASEIRQSQGIHTVFSADEFCATWRVPAADNQRQMTLVVRDGELAWNLEGRMLTAEQAAEAILRDLTSSIR
jgi:hypothetical protein